MASISKVEWYQEGFKVLVEAGATALTIDTLARRLAITKGSFYHHFKNYQDYKKGLLAYFEDLTTSQTIERLEKLTGPAEKIEGLLNITSSNSGRLEVALRAWALLDQEVYLFQSRLDTRRLAYLQELFAERGYQPAQARLMAELFYTIYVGSSHVVPELSMGTLYAEVNRLYRQSDPTKLEK
ncbi:MAG TPA: TetR/AcrR family transcriptional regulator [Chloroflexia bacterium]|nr:TetR/AcrR family transcriptional regulator [Chloroflexia bacterium]